MLALACGSIVMFLRDTNHKQSTKKNQPTTTELKIPEAKLAFSYPTKWGKPKIDDSNEGGHISITFPQPAGREKQYNPTYPEFYISKKFTVASYELGGANCASFIIKDNIPKEICAFKSAYNGFTEETRESDYKDYSIIETPVGQGVLAFEGGYSEDSDDRQIDINISSNGYTGFTTSFRHSMEPSVLATIQTLHYINPKQ
jgi:hypothetical protein